MGAGLQEKREMDLQGELARYPNTGRFLAGRLRHDMSEEEKQQLESLVGDTRQGDSCTGISYYGRELAHRDRRKRQPSIPVAGR